MFRRARRRDDRTLFIPTEPPRMGRLVMWAVIVLYVAVTAVLLAGCESFVRPAGVSDGLAYAEGQAQAIVKSCTTLNERRSITLAQAQQCQAATDQAFEAIDVARRLLAVGRTQDAQAQLQLVTFLLTEVQRLAQ